MSILNDTTGLDVVMNTQEEGQREAAEQSVVENDTTDTISVESIDKKYGTRIADFLNFVGKGWEGKEKFDTFVVAKRDAGNKSIDNLAREGKVPINGRIVVDTDVLNPNKHTQNADHNLTQEEWKNIILMLNDPSFKAVAIAKGTSKDSHMIILPMLHHNGKPMAVVVKQLFDRKGKHVGGIITAYGWTNNDTVKFVYGTTDDIDKISKDTSYESSQVNPAPSRKHPNDAANVENNSDTTKDIEENQSKSAEFMQVWHGSAAIFDQFDGAFFGTGEGSYVYGADHYVSNVRGMAEMYAGISLDQKVFNSGIDQVSREAQLFRRMYPSYKAFLDFAKPISDKMLSEGLISLQEHDDYLSLDEYYRRSEYNKRKQLYGVEIPDDNGHNYLSWNLTIPKSDRRKIADVVRNLPSDRIDTKHYGPVYKEDFETLANVIERNQYAAQEIVERLSGALIGGPVEASKVLAEVCLLEAK